MNNKDLFLEDNSVYRKYLPKITQKNDGNETENIWDIPYTITELSYLVHSHYRYYGKFPSVVAGQILEEIKPPSKDHYVLDNFCGSGTTLVECRLRSIKSYGVDISWISCLASNVKTRKIDISETKKTLSNILTNFSQQKIKIEVSNSEIIKKWFAEDIASELFTLQQLLLTLEKSRIRDFLVLAFLGIIRRVSKAHDGEVRPHINKTKKSRNVMEAFAKKVNEMCEDHSNFMALIPDEIESESYLADNINLPEFFNDGKCYLVVSHPPYLNSFNYTPVYKLEFFWGKPFEKDYSGKYAEFEKNELVAHPADEEITEKYFLHLKKCYQEAFRIQDVGSYLAIVIGDCTRNGILINVLDRVTKIVNEIGYKTYQINTRTTHYGLGKYAYKHRAQYHGESEKKEGILIFKK
jgi:hypothetical protein